MIDEQEEEGENGLIDEEEIEESFRWEPDIGILWESARDDIEPLFADVKKQTSSQAPSYASPKLWPTESLTDGGEV